MPSVFGKICVNLGSRFVRHTWKKAQLAGRIPIRSLCCSQTFRGDPFMEDAGGYDVAALAPFGPKQIKEGKAIFAADVSTEKVFYNPVQEFNRDLSCLVLAVFFERLRTNVTKRKEDKAARAAEYKAIQTTRDFPTQEVDGDGHAAVEDGAAKGFQGQILDAMAASGIRTCRYALEVPHVSRVVANDYDAEACSAIRKNAVANHVEEKLTVFQKDAKELMLTFGFKKELFHAIDLDPFGTAAPFFEGALQCIDDGGLLMVTCTDTAILCGNFPEACYARYGSTSVRNPAHHEISLRIVLNSIATRAMSHEKHIEPLLSLREGHYVRLFVAVHRGAEEAKETVRSTAMIFNCPVCHDFHLQPLCEKPKGFSNASMMTGNICPTCAATRKIGGPLWIGPLHNELFVADLIKQLEGNPGQYGTEKLMRGKLGMVQEELPDQPLYIVASEFFKVVHCTPIPSKQFLSAILHAGYKFSLSHCEKDSIKTDAPRSVLWDILRSWVRTYLGGFGRRPGSYSSRALTQTSLGFEVLFKPSKFSDKNLRNIHGIRPNFLQVKKHPVGENWTKDPKIMKILSEEPKVRPFDAPSTESKRMKPGPD